MQMFLHGKKEVGCSACQRLGLMGSVQEEAYESLRMYMGWGRGREVKGC